METMLLQNFIETEFLHNKAAEITWLASMGFSYEENPSLLSTSEVNRRKLMVRQSAERTFYCKVVVDFVTCDRHLLSVVTQKIAFR